MRRSAITTEPITTSRFRRFAKIALELALEIEDTGVDHQLCALVVSKNRVLSVGYNSHKTHPISLGTPMNQLHAEMHAVLQCSPEDLSGIDVVVARGRPSGKPGMAKPCSVCENILRRFGIRRVFYTISSENANEPEVEEMRL